MLSDKLKGASPQDLIQDRQNITTESLDTSTSLPPLTNLDNEIGTTIGLRVGSDWSALLEEAGAILTGQGAKTALAKLAPLMNRFGGVDED